MLDTVDDENKSSAENSETMKWVNDIRNRVLAIIEAEQLPRSHIAQKADVSEGTLGPWLNNKYAGRQENVAQKLSQWLAQRDEKEKQMAILPTAPKYQETLTSKKITGIIARAHLTGDLVLIGCGPGTGKTTTAKEYQSTRPNVYLVTFDPTSANVNTCLVEVLASMGVPDVKGTPYALMKLIISKIEGADACFIFDESQQLVVKAIELLRAIQDRTGCGMVFMGDERLFDIFGQNKGGQYSQLTSRIGYRHRQSKPKLEDVSVLLKAHGIESKAVEKIAFQISQKPGALRGVTKALLIARQRAALDSKPIDGVMLTDAWSNLAPEHQLGIKGA